MFPISKFLLKSGLGSGAVCAYFNLEVLKLIGVLGVLSKLFRLFQSSSSFAELAVLLPESTCILIGRGDLSRFISRKVTDSVVFEES